MPREICFFLGNDGTFWKLHLIFPAAFICLLKGPFYPSFTIGDFEKLICRNIKIKTVCLRPGIEHVERYAIIF
jgi:hypothetical protein